MKENEKNKVQAERKTGGQELDDDDLDQATGGVATNLLYNELQSKIMSKAINTVCQKSITGNDVQTPVDDLVYRKNTGRKKPVQKNNTGDSGFKRC